MAKVTAHLPPEIVDQIKRDAKANKQTISTFVGELIKQTYAISYNPLVESIIIKAASLTARSPKNIQRIITKYNNPVIAIYAIFANQKTFKIFLSGNKLQASFLSTKLLARLVSSGRSSREAFAEARKTVYSIVDPAKDPLTNIDNFLATVCNAYTEIASEEISVVDGLRKLYEKGLISKEDYEKQVKEAE